MFKKIDLTSIFAARQMRFFYQLIENGIFLFREFEGKNPELFGSEFSGNIRARLLSHYINMQLEEPGILEKNKCILKPSMEGGYKVPTLITDDVILTLRQCHSKEELLKLDVKYMKRYAKRNYVLDNQISFFDQTQDKNEKLYAILAYSDLDPVSYEPKFVELLFPRETMRGAYESIDLKPNIRLLQSWEELQEDSENIITSSHLKEKFIRQKGVGNKNE